MGKRGTVPTSLANLDPAAPMVHGGKSIWRGMAPPCRKCAMQKRCDEYDPDSHCKIAERLQDGIKATVLALPHIVPAIDEPLVNEYAKVLTAGAVVDGYIAEVGPFRFSKEEGLNVQPVLTRFRLALTNTACKLARELGLSPTARRSLERDAAESASAQLARLVRESVREELDTVEGEVARDDAEGE